MNPFTHNTADKLLKLLSSKDVVIDQGLDENEILNVEKAFGAQLPEDLKILLQAGVMKPNPNKDSEHNAYYPNWLDPKQEAQRCKEWIEKAFSFDIVNSNYWNEQFGEKPSDLDEAVVQAIAKISTWPALFPIFSHRYIPSNPRGSGNPVMSVWQSGDTVYYGANLEDYLNEEFQLGLTLENQPIKHVPFWADAFGI